MTAPRLLLLHGPNLSMLGQRDPAVYGTDTLADVVAAATAAAEEAGATLVAEQHDGEAALVRRLHEARTDGTDAVLINAGALTHYSVAIRDALDLFDGVVVEVHLSNIHARETFRHTSRLAAVSDAVVAGFGIHGYPLAVRGALDRVAAHAADA